MSNRLRLLGRAACTFPSFRPRFPWLGADLQTLKNFIRFVPPDLSAYPHHRLHLPLRDGSGDALWSLVNIPREDIGKPVVVLIHGLTGGEMSRNIQASAAYHLSRGFPVLRLNLRNAGPSLGKCRHFYNAGRSEDLRDAIAALPSPFDARRLFLIGVSLGGNLLLKCIAERAGLDRVIGAASVCAPIDLKAAQRRIMEPRNRLYHRHLLRWLIRDTQCIAGGLPMADRLHTLRTIYDFDDQVVAPMGGFESADDYYRRSSAAALLPSIEKPTLLITAANDPWIPVRSYLEREWRSDGPLTVAIASGGGHVGFHAKGSPVPWHNRAIGAFIDSLL
jgi:predicted alpha/beta-fold hydrolase